MISVGYGENGSVMRWSGVFWALGLTVAALLSVGILPSTALSEDLDAILRKGNELRRVGRDREALAEFQRAARIANTARVNAQIALAEQALGLWVEAETHMAKAGIRRGLGHPRRG